MKFAFNVKINQNSWGGGNSFLKIIYKFLRREGISDFDLSSKDLDAIFIIDPRSTISLAFPDVINYCLFKNNKTLIIHRIECNSKRYNSRIDIYSQKRKFADHTIFKYGLRIKI